MEPERASFATSAFYAGAGEIAQTASGDEIEITAHFTVKSRVRVTEGVFGLGNPCLADVYSPRRRCVAIVDEMVDGYYGAAIREYFAYHDIPLQIMSCPSAEDAKSMATVGEIQQFLGVNGANVARDEPVLVVGGGVLTDTAGLACALLHRRTPYVMVATSVVAAVDAGPSPRTCVNGDQFKNAIGAYHPPVLTLVDSALFATLEERHVRHGVAEIAKMGIVDDYELFDLVEQHGPTMIATRFGAIGGTPELRKVGNEILYKSLLSYLRHEGVNAFETHQARPHAYGHTWSPGYERMTKMLHGHAVAIDMAMGVELAELSGWLSPDDRDRVLNLLSSLGLAIYDPIMADDEVLAVGQRSMRAKRGGRALWAPLPRGGIGRCDYMQEVSPELRAEAVVAQRLHTEALPRRGAGIDAYVA